MTKRTFQKRHAAVLIAAALMLLGAGVAERPREESREALAPSVSYCLTLSNDGTLQLWETVGETKHLLYVKPHVSLRQQDEACLKEGLHVETRADALALFEDFAE